jgi:nitroimidazol reductase NimA-like FMN-containing flavoprotein (pyridoxamine 5'-phosphate oxidase superfamily)
MAQAPHPRVEVRRAPERASYERNEIESILDAGFICHLGFVPRGTEAGDGLAPVVLPTMYARIDDRIYVHGSPASRMLKTLRGPLPVCLTVTHLDGLVYARSAFHHSVNYRSVVVMGRATEVTDTEEKLAALKALIERFGAGRWADARKPSLKEFNKTLVLALPLDEASAKIRKGPPVDDDEDLEIAVWAGVVPVALTPGEPVPDPMLPPTIGRPAYLTSETR